jgi:hypothetical protein
MTTATLTLEFACEQSFKDRQIACAYIQYSTGHGVVEVIDLDPNADADIIGDSRWNLERVFADNPGDFAMIAWIQEYELKPDRLGKKENMLWLKRQLARHGYRGRGRRKSLSDIRLENPALASTTVRLVSSTTISLNSRRPSPSGRLLEMPVRV